MTYSEVKFHYTLDGDRLILISSLETKSFTVCVEFQEFLVMLSIQAPLYLSLAF